MAMPFGPRRRTDRGGDAGQHPLLALQEQQARRGADDERRFGVRPRQHDRAGEQGEQDHRPLGDGRPVQVAGEQADEHDGGDRQHHVDAEQGLDDAAREDEVEPPRQVRVDREEGDGRPVAGDVRDPLGEFARIAVLGDHPVPLAVPLGEDRLDHRPRALREWVAPALPVGDDLGGPGVGAEQHDDRETTRAPIPTARARCHSASPTPPTIGTVARRCNLMLERAHHRYIGRIRRRGPNAGARLPARPINRSTRPRWGRYGSSSSSIRASSPRGSPARFQLTVLGKWKSPIGTASSSPNTGPRTMPMVHGPTPGTRTSLSAAPSATERRPLPQPVGHAGDGDKRAGPLDLDADRVEPPRRHPRQPTRTRAAAAGLGTDPVAGSPSWRVSQRPLADRFSGRDPLADHRRQQGVIQVATGAGGEARTLDAPPW